MAFFIALVLLIFRSVALLIQASLPVALFADNQCYITLGGGTNADMAPPIDYFAAVFQPIVSRMGIQAEFELKMR